MTTSLVTTATREQTSWSFLTKPRDEYEAWRQKMVEDIWNDGEPLDWGVDPTTAAAIRGRTDSVAQHHGVPADDLYEDTILHMAVRPERIAHVEELPHLAYMAYQASRNLAQPGVRQAAREESLEAILAGHEEGWE